MGKMKMIRFQSDKGHIYQQLTIYLFIGSWNAKMECSRDVRSAVPGNRKCKQLMSNF